MRSNAVIAEVERVLTRLPTLIFVNQTDRRGRAGTGVLETAFALRRGAILSACR